MSERQPSESETSWRTLVSLSDGGSTILKKEVTPSGFKGLRWQVL